MSRATVYEILDRIKHLSEEDRLLLDDLLAQQEEADWRQEARFSHWVWYREGSNSADLSPPGGSGMSAPSHRLSTKAGQSQRTWKDPMDSEVLSTLMRKTVGILIFDGVELLDFAGPFEVFNATRLTPGPSARESKTSAPFEVFTIARSEMPVRADGDLLVKPHVSFDSELSVDILVIPGGQGTHSLLADRALLDWIRKTANEADLVASVCTGALLLAKTGLLKRRRATTHHAALELLASLDPTTEIDSSARVVDDTVITCGGVSAGIDLALYVVEKLYGVEVARDTARHIEYRGRWGG